MNQTNQKPDSAVRRSNPARAFFGAVYRHPILACAMLCALCMLMTTGSITFVKAGCISLFILLLGIGAAVCSAGLFPAEKKLRYAGTIAAASVCSAVLFGYGVFLKGSYSVVVMHGGLALCAGIFFFLLAAGKLTAKNIIILIFAAGFVMRLSYILMMTAGMIQHDVYYLGAEAGHTGYIEYLYSYGHLPDFDVRTVDQFYHPPLHHIIAAIWMRLQTLVGISYEDAHENIQILTLFYSTVCLILSYKIFRRLGLRGAGLVSATAVIAFCPTFSFMSGSINNDILSITFMLGAVLNTLYWYKSRSMGRILCIALCVGLGMFTKLSAWMVAPAIALLFVCVFFIDIKNFKKYIVQFSAFICVCAPIGLFWSVRNFLRWNVPFTFVQRLSEKSGQYVGDVSIVNRLFDFGFFQYRDVAPRFTNYDGEYNEYNPLVGFFKTSCFDEGIAVRRFERIEGFSHALFFSAVLLGLIAFGAMIYMLIKRTKTMDGIQKGMIFTLYFTILGMYYYFCFDFPQVCTMNVRYGVPVIVVGALSLGFLISSLFGSKKRLPRVSGVILCCLIAAYALCGFMVYSICADSLLRF